MEKINEHHAGNQKSLYLYTALIFIVALVVIILSFFGQSNLDKINKVTEDNKSISEKSAVLSEQNMNLVEENRSLKQAVTDKDEKIAALEAQLVTNHELIDTYNTLMTAHKFFLLKDYKQTREYLDTIDYNLLQSDSILLYTKMMDETNEGKEEE